LANIYKSVETDTPPTQSSSTESTVAMKYYIYDLLTHYLELRDAGCLSTVNTDRCTPTHNFYPICAVFFFGVFARRSVRGYSRGVLVRLSTVKVQTPSLLSAPDFEPLEEDTDNNDTTEPESVFSYTYNLRLFTNAHTTSLVSNRISKSTLLFKKNIDRSSALSIPTARAHIERFRLISKY